MVEAAMVFPLVILTVITVVCILIFLYRGVEMQSKMHIALRAEAGKITQTVNYKQQPEFIAPITKDGRNRLKTHSQIRIGKAGLLSGGEKTFLETCYLTDGTQQVRRWDLLHEKMENKQ